MSANEIYPSSIFFPPVHVHPHSARSGLLKRARLITHLNDGSVPSGARKSLFSFCQVGCTMGCHSPPARKLRDLVGGCWSSAGSVSKEMDGVVGEGARKWAAALLVKSGHRNIPWRVLKKFKCRGPTPDQLDLNCWELWGGPGMGICFCFSYIPQVILLISQRTICYMPTS